MQTNTLYTRCPTCNTAFKVTDNLLAMADGKVRCGACLAIFQATDYMLKPSARNHPEAVTKQKSDFTEIISQAQSQQSQPEQSQSKQDRSKQDRSQAEPSQQNHSQEQPSESQFTEENIPAPLQPGSQNTTHKDSVVESSLTERSLQTNQPVAQTIEINHMELAAEELALDPSDFIESDLNEPDYQESVLEKISVLEEDEKTEQITVIENDTFEENSDLQQDNEDLQSQVASDLQEIAQQQNANQQEVALQAPLEFEADTSLDEPVEMISGLLDEDSLEILDSFNREQVTDQQQHFLEIEGAEMEIEDTEEPVDFDEYVALERQESEQQIDLQESDDSLEIMTEEDYSEEGFEEILDRQDEDPSDFEEQLYEAETAIDYELEIDEIGDIESFDELSEQLTEQMQETDSEPDPLDEFDNIVEESKTGIKVKLALAVSVVVLVISLYSIWTNRQVIAWDKNWGSIMTSACQLLPCDLKPQRDVSKIKLLQRQLAPDEELENILDIKVLLINQAQFAQPYPTIKIAFSNKNGEQVSIKSFAPNDYLDANSLNDLMPSGSEVHIHFKTELTHPDALGFEFIFE